MRSFHLCFCILTCISLPLSAQDAAREEETTRYLIEGEALSDPRELPAQVTVISEDEIKAMASRDLGEILDSLAGIQVTRQGGASEPVLLSIRGATAEQVLVLVDGRRMNTAQGGGVDLSTLSAEDIERIEVIRGGGALQYGQGGLGGVVNLVLKKDAVPSPLAGHLSLLYGSFQDLQARMAFSGSLQEKALTFQTGLSAGFLEGSYAYLDEHAEDNRSQRNNTDRKFIDVSAAMQADPSDHLKLQWDIGAYLEEKGVPGTTEFPTHAARMENLRVSSALNLEQQLETFRWDADLSWIMQNRSYQDPAYFLGAIDDYHHNQAVDFRSNLYRSRQLEPVQWRNHFGLTGRMDFLESTAISTDSGILSAGRAIRWEGGLFYTGQWDLGRFGEDPQSLWISFFPSLRLDATPQNSGLSWNMGLSLPIGSAKKILLKSSTGTNYRIPGFDDLFWSSSAFAVGNPDLQPEELFYLDGGLTLDPWHFLNLNISCFYQQVDNWILWSLGPGGLWSPDNIGRAVMQGIEGDLKVLMLLSFMSATAETGISGTWMQAENRTEGSINEGMQLPRKPHLQASAYITLTHFQGFFLRGEARYNGLRYITPQNTKWLDPYWVIDLSAGGTLGKHWEINGNLQNLLNRSYVDIRDYPVPGIHGSIQLKYRWRREQEDE